MAARDDVSRRRVVPDAAGRSLWLAAAWTGVGAAIVCATLAIVAVAICWLPVSGPSAHPQSAMRAGLLTFLAALHGGVTVDRTAAAFLPLGLLLIVAAAAWRAGSALGDTAAALDETDPVRLVQAGLVQAAAFSVAAMIAVPFAHLGTSSAPVLGVGAAGLVLFCATGGVAYARASALGELTRARIPDVVERGARAAAAALVVYLGIGALLVAASLIAHASRVEALSREVGGGWGGVPILLLGLLSAPNAAVGGAAYLAGPGFAVGAGTHVGPIASTHGIVPAFPILGGLPDGPGAPVAVWVLVVLTPLLAGGCLARMCLRAATWRTRFAQLGAAIAIGGLAMAVLAWQGGGSIGAGRLSVVGASPWLAGIVVAGELATTATAWLGLVAALRWWAGHRSQPVAVRTSVVMNTVARPDVADAPRLVVVAQPNDADVDDAGKAGKLAG